MKENPYYKDDIVWYSPELDRYFVSKWDVGEVFIDPEHGPLKLCYSLNGGKVSEFYLVCYL